MLIWKTSMVALLAGATLNAIMPVSAKAQSASPRTLTVDVSGPNKPRDRMAQFSIGSDFPATLGRPDSIAQLRTTQQEIGFRYIRFHNVFADQLGVYREVNGKPVYDWTRIDSLYDQLLGMGLKPFVELGFTPDAMKTSNQTLFY